MTARGLPISEDGEDGLLVPAEDPRALRSAIKDVLDNPAKAKAMGHRARVKAQMFTTEEHFKRIIRLAVELTRSAESNDMVNEE